MSNDHIFPPDDVTDFFQEQPDQPKTKATEKSFTWSANVDIEYRLLGYTFQSYLERHADSWFTIVNKRSAMVRFGLPDRNGDSTRMALT